MISKDDIEGLSDTLTQRELDWLGIADKVIERNEKPTSSFRRMQAAEELPLIFAADFWRKQCLYMARQIQQRASEAMSHGEPD